MVKHALKTVLKRPAASAGHRPAASAGLSVVSAGFSRLAASKPIQKPQAQHKAILTRSAPLRVGSHCSGHMTDSQCLEFLGVQHIIAMAAE